VKNSIILCVLNHYREKYFIVVQHDPLKLFMFQNLLPADFVCYL